MDTVDRALAEAEQLADLKQAHNHQQRQATSLTHCKECGEEIPEQRRLAIKGCCLCVDCQRQQEAMR